jgi:hypothetical protein
MWQKKVRSAECGLVTKKLRDTGCSSSFICCMTNDANTGSCRSSREMTEHFATTVSATTTATTGDDAPSNNNDNPSRNHHNHDPHDHHHDKMPSLATTTIPVVIKEEEDTPATTSFNKNTTNQPSQNAFPICTTYHG